MTPGDGISKAGRAVILSPDRPPGARRLVAPGHVESLRAGVVDPARRAEASGFPGRSTHDRPPGCIDRRVPVSFRGSDDSSFISGRAALLLSAPRGQPCSALGGTCIALCRAGSGRVGLALTLYAPPPPGCVGAQPVHLSPDDHHGRSGLGVASVSLLRVRSAHGTRSPRAGQRRRVERPSVEEASASTPHTTPPVLARCPRPRSARRPRKTNLSRVGSSSPSGTGKLPTGLGGVVTSPSDRGWGKTPGLCLPKPPPLPSEDDVAPRPRRVPRA